ncbi:hypothetical protein MA16_Dca006628 [Dendrobium catenatum]|uniref:Uncharacterized protein n=1 Tax=Dendrobium catenatum TaxID=906689 RepID=A0A2I0X5M7_9ASPA|nr:hypothetical protein MA16_Dca006628 [Dendrobium catenatum]
MVAVGDQTEIRRSFTDRQLLGDGRRPDGGPVMGGGTTTIDGRAVVRRWLADEQWSRDSPRMGGGPMTAVAGQWSYGGQRKFIDGDVE